MSGRVDPAREALRLVAERPGHYTTRMLRAAVREASLMSKGDVYAAVQRLEDLGSLELRVNEAKSRKRRLRYYLGDAAESVNGKEPSRARVEPPVSDAHPSTFPKKRNGGKSLGIRTW